MKHWASAGPANAPRLQRLCAAARRQGHSLRAIRPTRRSFQTRSRGPFEAAIMPIGASGLVGSLHAGAGGGTGELGGTYLVPVIQTFRLSEEPLTELIERLKEALQREPSVWPCAGGRKLPLSANLAFFELVARASTMSSPPPQHSGPLTAGKKQRPPKDVCLASNPIMRGYPCPAGQNRSRSQYCVEVAVGIAASRGRVGRQSRLAGASTCSPPLQSRLPATRRWN